MKYKRMLLILIFILIVTYLIYRYIYREKKEVQIKDSDEISQITDNLFLSNIQSAMDEDVIKRYNIKRMISVMEYRVYPPKQIKDHLHIKVYDHPFEDIKFHFDTTYDFIDKSNDNILVHCYAGISRSATIVLNYLKRKYNLSREEAFALLKRKRSIINPNQGFYQQLE